MTQFENLSTVDGADVVDEAFFASVRVWVIVLILILTLYILSYYSLRRFRKLVLRADDDWDELHFYSTPLTFQASALSLAVAILPVCLLPLTIVSRSVSGTGPFATQWLNMDLVQSLWTVFFIATKVCLFVVVPFTYFYHEMDTPNVGLTEKLRETGIMVALLAVLLYVPLKVVRILWFQSDLWMEHQVLDAVTSFAGALLILYSAPSGIASVLKAPFKPLQLERRMDLLNKLDFEEQALLMKLELSSAARASQSLAPDVVQIEQELASIRNQRALLQSESSRRRLLRNIVRSCGSLLDRTLSVFFTLELTFVCVLEMFSRPVRTQSLMSFFLLGYSGFGGFVDSILVLYFLMATVKGLLTTSVLFSPTHLPNSSVWQRFLANVAACLVVSASLPDTICLLGLSCLRVEINVGSHTSAHSHVLPHVFVVFYRILMLGSILRRSFYNGSAPFQLFRKRPHTPRGSGTTGKD